jgi:hypothetical protein
MGGQAARRPRCIVVALSLVASVAVGLALWPDILTAQVATPPGRADVAITMRNRTFIIPRDVVDGWTIQPTLRIDWWLRDGLRLAVDAQTVDNSGPGRQGRFRASRTVGPEGGSGNFLQELTLGAELRLLGDSAQRRALGLELTVSRAVRSYLLQDTATGAAFGGNRRELVPALSLVGRLRGDRLRIGVGPEVAFFPAQNALYVRRAPGEPRRFGPTVGASLSAEAWLTTALSLWAHGFVPVSGNNTISRETGRPVRYPAYDAGVRLELSSALRTELFVSNALGDMGALADVADREYRAIGVGLSFLPTRRAVRPAGGPSGDERRDGPRLGRVAALTLAEHEGVVAVAGGSQGVAAAAAASPVDGLQLGAYVDYTSGVVDEGELGASVGLRLTPRRVASRVSAGLVVTGARSNNVLINFLGGARDEFRRRGYTKSGFAFGDESVDSARLYMVAVAVPVERTVGARGRMWLAPAVGLIQREGIEVAGLIAGGSVDVAPSVTLLAESGISVGRGNTLTADGRRNRLPWNLAAGWRLPFDGVPAPTLEAFVTNRVGQSVFHALRVRDRGRPAFGVALRMPFAAP